MMPFLRRGSAADGREHHDHSQDCHHFLIDRNKIQTAPKPFHAIGSPAENHAVAALALLPR
jgi:hypothetical protein